MSDDPIVLEIRKRREEYAASLGYDLDRIVADLQLRQGRVVVDRSLRGKAEPSDAQDTPSASTLNFKSTPPSP